MVPDAAFTPFDLRKVRDLWKVIPGCMAPTEKNAIVALEIRAGRLKVVQ